MDLGLDGRVAVVCASTDGLGRAIAEALAQEGARVVVSGRRADLARVIAGDLPHAVGVGVDLLDPDGPEQLMAATIGAFGPPDIVVLNGPGPRPARVTDIKPNDLAQAVDSLVTSHHRLLEHAIPHMRHQRWGRVLAVGSSATYLPTADLALSGIGRSALAFYLKALATEVAPDRVTVNMVHPGRIETERVRRLDSARADASGRSSTAERESSASRIPAHRYGSPNELAAVAAFLCSDRASYVTGTAIRCDGGLGPVM